MSTTYTTGIPGYTLRKAAPADCALILEFIVALAEYEHLASQVVATEEGLRRSIFENREAEVLIGEYNGTPVAFCVFYYPYSTFLGGVYLYLEDIFVKEPYRGRGFGKVIFNVLAGIAQEKGITRIEWWCLDWNTSSIAFYESLGAEAKREFVTFRLHGEAITALAAGGGRE